MFYRLTDECTSSDRLATINVRDKYPVNGGIIEELVPLEIKQTSSQWS